MAQEKKGYALKVERGERPFRYSDELIAWRNNPTPNNAERWSRRHGMWPVRRSTEPAQ